MAKPILVANWKNRPSSLDEVKKLLTGLSKKSTLYKKLHTYIAPPHVYYETVFNRTRTFAKAGSQSISTLSAKESHTGEVTPDMLQSFGVKLAIIGHSEVRAKGETSIEVREKVGVALKAGIVPLVCVGESERDQDAKYLERLRDQIKSSLEGVRRKDLERVMVAYEPVWAIGKSAKNAIDHEDLAEMVVFIRRVLTDLFGRPTADKVAILYGGSVEPANATELMRNTGIRGFLVGRASLKPLQFAELAEILIAK